MSAFLLSTLVIFVAELGDKSQLVALWFATRYRWWTVIAGVAAATLVVHLGSVAAGRALDDVLPETVLRVIVGLSFLGFAWWSIRGDSLDEDDQRVRFGWAGAFGVVTLSFFLSELGDKTQLATVSLASREESFVGVWLGSTSGMVAADAIAVAIGLVAGKRMPQRTVGLVAAVLFVFFGVVTITSAFV
ncbi:MAG: TMEM165/GDT1 family protein [Dehalococcoidia bacterium]|nr:MAG: TMEM165/GDT1 family protein [Dehalococcoidia bacterium]